MPKTSDLALTSILCATALGTNLVGFTVHAPVGLGATTDRVGAQSSRAADPQSNAPPDAAGAKRALSAGRAEEAITLADQALMRAPGQIEAATVKVEALLGLERFTAALDAYDAWFKVSQSESAPLVARLARAQLDVLTREDLSAVKVDALGALAASGRADARKALESAAWATPPSAASWPAIVSLAKVGDAKAGARVLETARTSLGGAKAEALHALAQGRVAGGEAVLREALATPDANLQAAAASTASDLGLRALVPDLERTAKQGDQFGRFAAAVAVAKLGGSGGDAIIDAALKSPASDARLLAASARKAQGRPGWIDVVRPLLQNMDGLIRFQAAELLLSTDRKAALEVLVAGTVDPNLNVRAEVARILAADKDLDLAQFRRLLRDGAPRVRLEAARALLARTGSGRGASGR